MRREGGKVQGQIMRMGEGKGTDNEDGRRGEGDRDG